MFVGVLGQEIPNVKSQQTESDYAQYHPENRRLFVLFTVGLAVNSGHRRKLDCHLRLQPSLRRQSSDIIDETVPQHPVAPEMPVPPPDQPVPGQYEKDDCDDYTRDKSGDSSTEEADTGARRPSQCPPQEEAPEENTEERDDSQEWREDPEGRHDVVGFSPYTDRFSDGVSPELGGRRRCQMR